ncbi:ABC transporter permease [Phytoactinopolyspora limicola]|uniref:ABC transporter permease n=1 Tax=Phytoactinopolyspora limicola TaxID=2715536 RepID=UPI001407C4C0|nr:ABC transporter permease [Phytoactinopolyspora limicola]
MSGRFLFVGKRLILAVPLLLGVVLLVFLLLQITPGDPARQIVGLRASEADVAQVRDQLGLDDSVFSQYARYLGGVVQGDLGFSYKSRQPVADMVAARLPVSGWLVISGLVVSLMITIPLGVWAAIQRDRAGDHITRGVSLLGIAMPSFWVGLMLILLVALPTGWFPVGGFGDTFGQRLNAIVLPAVTLGIAMAPIQIRSLRASIIRCLGSDYVAAGRALGASGFLLVRRFVLRNAASSMVTLAAVQTSFLLFTMVVLETTFGLPGLGQGMVMAAVQRDLPAVQGYTLVFALTVVLVYLLADVVNAVLDPRVEIRG